jgi:hypothetical protein
MSRLNAPVVFVLLSITVFLVSCSNPTPVPTTQPTPVPTTYSVTLFCQDCADIGMKINIWTSTSKVGVAGSVPHNTQVTVYGVTTYDGVVFYNVGTNGIRGWITEMFVQK